MNGNIFRSAMNKINVTHTGRRRPKVGGNGIWKYAEMMSQNRTEENEEFIVSSVSMYFYNVHFLLLQIIFCDGDENLWLISLLFNFIVDWQICFDDLYLNVNCSVKEFLLHQLFIKCWTNCESCLLKTMTNLDTLEEGQKMIYSWSMTTWRLLMRCLTCLEEFLTSASWHPPSYHLSLRSSSSQMTSCPTVDEDI